MRFLDVSVGLADSDAAVDSTARAFKPSIFSRNNSPGLEVQEGCTVAVRPSINRIDGPLSDETPPCVFCDRWLIPGDESWPM
jgi:hypothetical protein